MNFPTISNLHFAIGIQLGISFIVLCIYDIRSYRLPNFLTLPLLAGGLLLTASNDPSAFPNHVLAALLGWALFMGLMLLFRRWRGYEGLGEGDAKLMAAGGAWLGPFAIGPILLTSSAQFNGFDDKFIGAEKY
ncbi:MAG: prepilin peptidase [Cohaesibacteraceae bacterium]|nr:prepilin peptidase [Cohaesibacteraceae bacterium]